MELRLKLLEERVRRMALTALQAGCLFLAQEHVLGLGLLFDAHQQVFLATHIQRNDNRPEYLRSEERRHPLGTVAAPENQPIALGNAIGSEIRGGALSVIQQFGIGP